MKRVLLVLANFQITYAVGPHTNEFATLLTLALVPLSKQFRRYGCIISVMEVSCIKIRTGSYIMIILLHVGFPWWHDLCTL
jgi:hypothetical protein